MLIDLAYRASNRKMLDAYIEQVSKRELDAVAGRIDTWLSEHCCWMDFVRNHIAKEEAARGEKATTDVG